MKRYVALVVMLVLLILLFFYENSPTPEKIISQNMTLSVLFCPHDDCESALVAAISSANISIHCALYEINLPSVIRAFDNSATAGIDVQVITERDFYDINRSYIVPDNNSQAMHNKFCIVDEQLVTAGSMNPTENDAHKNNNNLLIFNSSTVAAIFEGEFQELSHNVFGKGDPSFTTMSAENSSFSFFFCPDDGCSTRVQSLIASANRSIDFATFSFTDDAIASELLLARDRGVLVRGIFEKRLSTRDSVMQKLQYQNISVYTDGNKYTMHHKFFVIDDKIVITGSYNPTQNGNVHNDEHVVIISDDDIARQYVAEFDSLFEEAIQVSLS